ncbi:MAG: RNA methyltransferase [Ardenticatenaceae bacterium]|nr:RNA methyltransferase [Anaerolineales bacterium]MCB8921194.1 RNA methyltransferase [Ardenticatenaceae bacterium]MCB9004266.1 RNA methyltransferase [Ardenticatenaceae bacterium]
MSVRITSLQNGRIKHVTKLNQRRYRDHVRLTIVEGVREVSRALQHGITPQEAFICPELLPGEAETAVARLHALAQQNDTQLYEVTTAVFAKMAYRGDSGGLLVTIPYLNTSLDNLTLSATPLLVVIEGAEKPGNVGAILRTADGVGVDGVILSSDGPSTDLHNPNVIRASLGTLFSVGTAVAANDEILAWLHKHQIQIVAAAPAASDLYTSVDLAQPTAIIAGSEAYGLSNTWLAGIHQQVRIPMQGTADSLNLSISVAILLYEAVRQRQLT